MCQDNDVKIAGNRPSKDVKLNKKKEEAAIKLDDAAVKLAKSAGAEVAKRYLNAVSSSEYGQDNKDFDLLIQRRLMLSFTATVGFEQYIEDDALSGIAQKSFLDTLKKSSPEIYATAADTGAFSFYYLAYRRGGDTERRMGQTFAMLCSHDGDPIFQELGEALYCWFLSDVKKVLGQFFKA